MQHANHPTRRLPVNEFCEICVCKHMYVKRWDVCAFSARFYFLDDVILESDCNFNSHSIIHIHRISMRFIFMIHLPHASHNPVA